MCKIVLLIVINTDLFCLAHFMKVKGYNDKLLSNYK